MPAILQREESSAPISYYSIGWLEEGLTGGTDTRDRLGLGLEAGLLGGV